MVDRTVTYVQGVAQAVAASAMTEPQKATFAQWVTGFLAWAKDARSSSWIAKAIYSANDIWEEAYRAQEHAATWAEAAKAAGSPVVAPGQPNKETNYTRDVANVIEGVAKLATVAVLGYFAIQLTKKGK